MWRTKKLEADPDNPTLTQMINPEREKTGKGDSNKEALEKEQSGEVSCEFPYSMNILHLILNIL